MCIVVYQKMVKLIYFKSQANAQDTSHSYFASWRNIILSYIWISSCTIMTVISPSL